MPEIQTISDAIRDLEQGAVEGYSPDKAIRFLKDQTFNDEIDDRISWAIREANNPDHFYNEETDEWLMTPLYYAWIAEEHLSEKLVKALIHYATTTYEGKFLELEEQLRFLAGKLGAFYPETIPPRFLKVFRRQAIRQSDKTYEILLQALYFIDKNQYHQELLEILNLGERTEYWDIYVDVLSHLQLMEALPKVEEIYDKNEGVPFLFDSKEEVVKRFYDDTIYWGQGSYYMERLETE